MKDKKLILVDVDGTVAEITHRQHFVLNKPRNWAAFNKNMDRDLPHDDIIWLVKTLHSAGCTIIMCSGRGEESRKVTEEWLVKYDVPYTELFMRPLKDSRADYIIKTELLEQIRAKYGEPYMAIDDRDQVVEKTWRANGIRCLQCAPGNF